MKENFRITCRKLTTSSASKQHADSSGKTSTTDTTKFFKNHLKGSNSIQLYTVHLIDHPFKLQIKQNKLLILIYIQGKCSKQENYEPQCNVNIPWQSDAKSNHHNVSQAWTPQHELCPAANWNNAHHLQALFKIETGELPELNSESLI